MLSASLNETFPCFVHRYLTNPAKDVDLRKWATEGLAYLTLDADIKEELVNDEPALQSVFDLAKVRLGPVGRAGFTHVEAPGQPSVVELWWPTLS